MCWRGGSRARESATQCARRGARRLRRDEASTNAEGGRCRRVERSQRARCGGVAGCARAGQQKAARQMGRRRRETGCGRPCASSGAARGGLGFGSCKRKQHRGCIAGPGQAIQTRPRHLSGRRIEGAAACGQRAGLAAHAERHGGTRGAQAARVSSRRASRARQPACWASWAWPSPRIAVPTFLLASSLVAVPLQPSTHASPSRCPHSSLESLAPLCARRSGPRSPHPPLTIPTSSPARPPPPSAAGSRSLAAVPAHSPPASHFFPISGTARLSRHTSQRAAAGGAEPSLPRAAATTAHSCCARICSWPRERR